MLSIQIHDINSVNEKWPCAHRLYTTALMVIFPLLSNCFSGRLVDARVRSVFLSNVLGLGWRMLPSIGMGGLMTLPLFSLILVSRLDSVVGRRSMSSVNGAWIVIFPILIYVFLVLMGPAGYHK